LEFQQENVAVIDIILVHTLLVSHVPLLWIMALEGHVGITVSLDMHSMNLKRSEKTATLAPSYKLNRI
jgi:uncharacterized protein YqfA (UPF0365 family)